MARLSISRVFFTIGLGSCCFFGLIIFFCCVFKVKFSTVVNFFKDCDIEGNYFGFFKFNRIYLFFFF